MRICIINLEYYSHCGGAGTVAKNLSKELAAIGEEVFFITLSNNSSRQYLQEKNYHICEIHYPEKRTIHQLIKYYYEIYHTISESKVDIILTPPLIYALPSFLNFLIHKTPYCLWIHNDLYLSLPNKIKQKFERYNPLNKMGREFIAVSPSISKPLYEIYRRHTVVIENGANLKAFYPKPIITPPTSENCRIISVSRLVSGKGFEDAIAAMSEIVKIYPNAELILVGDGPLRSTLETQVKQLHLENNVTFTGFVPNNELLTYYHQAHLYLLPSWNEGFPIVLFEAMGCGLPIVSTCVGAVPTVISEENGVLVPIKSPEKIVEAVCHILSLPKDKYEKMSKRNVAVAQEHSWENVAKQYLEVFQDVLAEK